MYNRSLSNNFQLRMSSEWNAQFVRSHVLLSFRKLDVARGQQFEWWKLTELNAIFATPQLPDLFFEWGLVLFSPDWKETRTPLPLASAVFNKSVKFRQYWIRLLANPSHWKRRKYHHYQVYTTNGCKRYRIDWGSWFLFWKALPC